MRIHPITHHLPVLPSCEMASFLPLLRLGWWFFSHALPHSPLRDFLRDGFCDESKWRGEKRMAIILLPLSSFFPCFQSTGWVCGGSHGRHWPHSPRAILRRTHLTPSHHHRWTKASRMALAWREGDGRQRTRGTWGWHPKRRPLAFRECSCFSTACSCS